MGTFTYIVLLGLIFWIDFFFFLLYNKTAQLLTLSLVSLQRNQSETAVSRRRLREKRKRRRRAYTKKRAVLLRHERLQAVEVLQANNAIMGF